MRQEQFRCISWCFAKTESPAFKSTGVWQIVSNVLVWLNERPIETECATINAMDYNEPLTHYSFYHNWIIFEWWAFFFEPTIHFDLHELNAIWLACAAHFITLIKSPDMCWIEDTPPPLPVKCVSICTVSDTNQCRAWIFAQFSGKYLKASLCWI